MESEATLTGEFGGVPTGVNADKLLSDMQAEPMKSALLTAGFAKGDAEFLDLFVRNFKRIAARMR